MAYSVYTFASQYTDTGLVGVYVGTREENVGECLDIASRELAEIAAVQARLRASHLKAHIATTALLTPDQVDRYNRSRGYASTRGAYGR